MHAGGDEIVDQPAEHVALHAAVAIDRRYQIRKDAV